jgi:hypothetical protein
MLQKIRERFLVSPIFAEPSWQSSNSINGNNYQILQDSNVKNLLLMEKILKQRLHLIIAYLSKDPKIQATYFEEQGQNRPL